MNKLLLSILSLLFVATTLKAQNNDDSFTEVSEFGSEPVEPKEDNDFLGFMLLPGSCDLVRFYEIHINKNNTIKYQQLSKDDFMYRAAGKIRSAANPNGINLFESYGIKDPNIVNHLWKLRYKEYPYECVGKPEQGWSTDSLGFVPSAEQYQILKKYGISRVQDLCYGDMAFLLFKDMASEEWLKKYSGGNASWQQKSRSDDNSNATRSDNDADSDDFIDGM